MISFRKYLQPLQLLYHAWRYQRSLFKCSQWAVGCWGRLCACPYTSCQWRRSLPSQKCHVPGLICWGSASAEYHGLLADVALRSVRCHLWCKLQWQAWKKRRGQVAHITLAVPHHVPFLTVDRSCFQAGFERLSWTESIWNLFAKPACIAPIRSGDFLLVLIFGSRLSHSALIDLSNCYLLHLQPLTSVASLGLARECWALACGPVEYVWGGCYWQVLV